MNLANIPLEDLQQELKFRREIKLLEKRVEVAEQILSLAKVYKDSVERELDVSKNERKICQLPEGDLLERLRELTYV